MALLFVLITRLDPLTTTSIDFATMSETLSRPLQAGPSQLDSHLSVDKECSIVERQTSLEDIHDPRRWSVTKKRLTLGIICFIAFVPDFASATGIITVIPQTKYV